MIEVRNISLGVGEFRLENVSLGVGDGEYFVLMGPTGSGKSLLVKCICGLVRPAGGAVLVDGRDVTVLEPRCRNVGYVPQDCGLFGHLSVAGNITFARRARGLSHAAMLREMDPLIELLGLTELLGRRTGGLSGGERQKVALARALASRPRLLVLDEPVSALDELTRRDVCAELKRTQRSFELATIHVCHNSEEALSVADRIGIMAGGQLVQAARPEQLQADPATETVARLFPPGR